MHLTDVLVLVSFSADGVPKVQRDTLPLHAFSLHPIMHSTFLFLFLRLSLFIPPISARFARRHETREDDGVDLVQCPRVTRPFWTLAPSAMIHIQRGLSALTAGLCRLLSA